MALPPGQRRGRPLGIFMTDCCAATSPVELLRCYSPARKLSPVRVPHLCPQIASRRLCRSNMHMNHAMLAPIQMEAMPSQREGQGFESP
jgi:hypothetical protein